MKGFFLLLFACIVATCGFCQEPDYFGLDAVMPDVADGLLSVEDEVCSEDLSMVVFLEDPQEDSQEEDEEKLTSESPGIAVTPQFDYKESKYWGSYIALRTAGWITLGTGAVFFISGYSCILGAWGAHDAVADRLAIAGSIMLVSSPILVVTSIPLLACAYYNRSKAKKMYLNVGASMLPSGSLSPFKASTPALSLALTF